MPGQLTTRPPNAERFVPYFAGITSGSRSSELSLGEDELLNSGFVDDNVCWWGPPMTFCSRTESDGGWPRFTLTTISMMVMMTVNTAPITIPRSGDMGRSPSDAVTDHDKTVTVFWKREEFVGFWNWSMMLGQVTSDGVVNWQSFRVTFHGFKLISDVVGFRKYNFDDIRDELIPWSVVVKGCRGFGRPPLLTLSKLGI